MPHYEFDCPRHGRIKRFYKSFPEAASHIDRTVCGEVTKDGTTLDDREFCGEIAQRALSAPFQPICYGNPEGYGKPSATKRYSTKLVSQKDGNKYAAG